MKNEKKQDSLVVDSAEAEQPISEFSQLQTEVSLESAEAQWAESEYSEEIELTFSQHESAPVGVVEHRDNLQPTPEEQPELASLQNGAVPDGSATSRKKPKGALEQKIEALDRQLLKVQEKHKQEEDRIKQQIKALRQAQSKQKRKDETRAKILSGVVLMAAVNNGELTQENFQEWMSQFLSEQRDREFLHSYLEQKASD